MALFSFSWELVLPQMLTLQLRSRGRRMESLWQLMGKVNHLQFADIPANCHSTHDVVIHIGPPGARMFEDGIAYYTFTRDNSFDHRF